MAKKVILAVAGAGKTYHICHTVDPTKKNLILAYTHENIYNIQKELCEAYGKVPDLTRVETFDSFVYHNLILPYEPSILEHFGITGFRSTGITMIDPPPQRIKNRHGDMIPNPAYRSKDKFLHYITTKGQYYCATLSELTLQTKHRRESLIKRGAQRLNYFFDAIFIDEFQDYREHNYDLIMKLSKLINNVILVGDYYQHSVSATNNSGKPFKKKGKDIVFSDFVAEIEEAGFSVDCESLAKSRRCSIEVCDYVRKKLEIDIVSNGDHDGKVIWVEEKPEQILDDDYIVKLVFRDSASFSFTSMNWSYSKGDTVGAACVILTESLENFDKDDFSIKNVPISTRNRLYVAMTRSAGNLYIMKASTFKNVKQQYLA